MFGLLVTLSAIVGACLEFERVSEAILLGDSDEDDE